MLKNKTFLKSGTGKIVAIYLLLMSIFFWVYSVCQIKVFSFNTEKTNLFFGLDNNSIYSILIASQLAFAIILLICYYNYKKVNFLFIVFSVSSFFALVLLVYLKGRAAWLGVFVSLLFIINSKYELSKKIKKVIRFSPILILLFIVGLFFYKKGSSNGRLLIYKISFKILTDNPIFGAGIGQFKVNYNNYQAAYFATNSIDSKEALLANNTFYAFNDYYEFLIENGIVGFSVLLLISFLFYKKVKETVFTEAQKPIATAAIASILCILTSALFSYPLQILPIIIQFLLCSTILVWFIIANITTTTPLQKKLQKALVIGLLAVFGIYQSFQFAYKSKSENALELSRTGYKKDALQLYSELSSSNFNDGNDMFLYAKELYNVGQVIKAKEVLNIAKTKISFNEVYKFSATIETELKYYKNAEADLKKVVFMIPNRMQPRYNLMEFYLAQKDTANAAYWANSIINMPVKIPSETTRSIQQKVKLFLTK